MALIPTPFKDEFSCGFFRRVLTWGESYSPAEFLTKLRQELGLPEQPVHQLPIPEILAQAADMPLHQFLENHTFLPLIRAVRSTNDEDPNQSHVPQTGIIYSFGMRLLQPIARQCPTCLQEDTQDIGHSYWRRTHQLPGIYICPTHGAALQEIGEGKRAFEIPPSPLRNEVCRFTSAELRDIAECQALQRYYEILEFLLTSNKPVNVSHLRFFIRKRIQALNSQHSTGHAWTTFSAKALEELPHAWLFAEFPSLASLNPGEYFPPLDAITSWVMKPQIYALSLALLFTSTNEALDLWRRCNKLFMGIGMPDTGFAIPSDAPLQQSTLSSTKPGVNSKAPPRGLEQAVIAYSEGMSLENACRLYQVPLYEVENSCRPHIFEFACRLRESLSAAEADGKAGGSKKIESPFEVSVC